MLWLGVAWRPDLLSALHAHNRTVGSTPTPHLTLWGLECGSAWKKGSDSVLMKLGS